MQSNLKRKLAIGSTVAAAAAFAGGAYAASSSSTNPRHAFLNDVAGRLHVSPTQLQDALKGAFGDQLNAAVSAGRLTQAQANAIKQRLANRPFPPVGPGHAFFAHPGFQTLIGARARAHGRSLSEVANYLGLSESQLLSQLRSGKSLAAIAKAQHKSVSGLKATLYAAAKARLDKAVAAKMLTSAEEQKILSRLSTRLDERINGTRPAFGGHRGFGAGGPGWPGRGGGMPPGGPPSGVPAPPGP